MNHQWIWFAVLAGMASAMPMKAEELIKLFQDVDLGRNNAIENVIINALEDLRELMVTGNENIPVLDPLHVDHVLLDDSVIPIPGASIELNNLVVSNLSTFETQQVSVVTTNVLLRRFHVEVQLGVPLIDVDVGQYDLFVTFWGLDIFGRGDTKISITKPWFKIDSNVNIRLTWNGEIYLNMMDLRLDAGLDDIQFSITGLFNDPSVDDFANRYLRNIILEYTNFWADDISDIISPIVLDVANDILSDINLVDFLP